ncbi:MAG: protein kinase [Gemmatimonadaceae bacterium]|nr:protein kinase [Gemmatimonadaceae bacterium]MDQ3243755.1 protein kinase [Gemmatimonadota bacterium]
MAKKLRVGDSIRGYRVTKVFGPGMMAISYGAQSAGGEKIFLKQYKSPAPTVIWYNDYVEYQRELSRRVREGKGSHYAVRMVDAFEERWGGPCYFQAYEFIEHGGDLQQMLDEEREQHRRTKAAPIRDPAVWARHVTWSKVLMAGIAALHESKIVHADLKPPNAYLIKDPTLGSGYQLKLIDTDFSVLADKRAPWHGYQGYIGSDNYRSPEHITRGGIPALPSDIFTAGLILHELLVGTHPYWRDDQAEYAQLVRAYAIKPPALAGLMPAPAKNADVSAAIYRCLSPDASKRPTAAELRAALSGRAPKGTASGPAGSGRKVAAVKPAAAAKTGSGGGAPVGATASGTSPATAPLLEKGALATERIQLVATDGKSIQIGVRTEIGKTLARQFGAEGEFWDSRQLAIERGPDGQWIVTPFAETANDSLLNGQILTAAARLRDGDTIAVGRHSKGIVKLPLKVRAI